METAMDEKTREARTIAAEEVGEARGTPIPDAAKNNPATEEVIRQLATSAGPEADIATKTAEVKAESRKVARTVASQASRAAQPPFITVAGGFALGYAAALLIHRRQ